MYPGSFDQTLMFSRWLKQKHKNALHRSECQLTAAEFQGTCMPVHWEVHESHRTRSIYGESEIRGEHVYLA